MSESKCACGNRYPIPEAAAGREARCEKCGGAIPVPTDDDFDLLAPFFELADTGDAEPERTTDPPPHASTADSEAEPRASIVAAAGVATSSGDATAGVDSAAGSLFSALASPDSRRNAIALAILFTAMMLGYIGAGTSVVCRGTSLTTAQATGIQRQLARDFSVVTDDRRALGRGPLSQRSPKARE